MPTAQVRKTTRLAKRRYFADPKNRSIKRQRDRDRYHYEKKNWKIPKWYELDHAKWYGKWRKQVIPKKLNRQKWAYTTNKRFIKKIK